MKHVWVIEQGEYSEYRVVGVYSSHENAKRVCDALNAAKGYATVSRWILDPAVKELNQGLRQHLVFMLRDGTVERVEGRDLTAYDLGGEARIWRRSTAPAYRGTNTPDVLNATVWAKDEKHAIKIANEIRAEMIASGQWK